MKTLFKRLFLCFCVIALLFSSVGCKPDNLELGSSDFVENVEKDDNEIFLEILNYNLIYDYTVPGCQLSYNYLWEGYDTENKFGPNLSKNSRIYTFLTDYREQNEYYYLIYQHQMHKQPEVPRLRKPRVQRFYRRKRRRL